MLQGTKSAPRRAHDELEVDARVIAAPPTRDLSACVRKAIREDWFYRICSDPIELPPLREADEDYLI